MELPDIRIMQKTPNYISSFSKYCKDADRIETEKDFLEMRKAEVGNPNRYKLPKDKKKRAKRLQQIQDQERARRLARIQRGLD